jgi:hypothetical protein
MTLRNDVVTTIYFPSASNALWISDDTVPGIGEAGRRSEHQTQASKQPNDGSMGSTVHLLILTQHVVPKLR